MEWKKENISASELERRQKEYMNEALSMMKKSGSPHSLPEKLPEPVTPAGSIRLTEEASDKLSEANVDQPDEQQPDEQKPDVQEPDEQEPDVQEPEKQQPIEKPATEQPTDDNDDKYGVYTADEVLSGEYSGEGLKKAAEILEEMTRSTEMMKKLANGDDEGESDTTDFPDFSGGIDGGGRFREDEETKDCTAEEK